MRSDPPPELLDCLLVHGGWHAAARWCQLSRGWRAAVVLWRNGQRCVSITSNKSGGNWLNAWDRPELGLSRTQGMRTGPLPVLQALSQYILAAQGRIRWGC